MTDSKPIRVLLADDHAIVRKGIRGLLTQAGGMEVVGESSDGEQAVALTEQVRPDVVLMDLQMPGTDGIEVTRRIVEHQLGGRVLVLTSFASDDKVFPAIKVGALGYLLKDSDSQDLVQAIHQVYRGEPSLHPTIARKLLQELSHPAACPLTPDPLSGRELEVLSLMA